MSFKAAAVYGDLVTAYGRGVDTLWRGLLSRKSAIAPVTRFDTQKMQSRNAACVAGLDCRARESLAMQMLEPLLQDAKAHITPQTMLFLATTNGEIDLLERDILSGAGSAAQSNAGVLLEKVKKVLGVKQGVLVSAACASAATAAAHAARYLKYFPGATAIVAAVDCVSEFVFSGFSSLMALDPARARPFDKDRKGLTAGEGAGVVVFKSSAAVDKKEALFNISGWGASCDANHITGPARDGAGLSLAIEKARVMAGIGREAITGIYAHGTGTVYNDAMEIKAFKRILASPVPVCSIKGAIGHTMAFSGLAEMLAAGRSLREKLLPATIGLNEPDSEAAGWAGLSDAPLAGALLKVNSGFGGINCALILEAPDA